MEVKELTYGNWKVEMKTFLTIGFSNYSYATSLLFDIVDMTEIDPDLKKRFSFDRVLEGGNFYLNIDGEIVNIDLRLKVGKERVGDFRTNYFDIEDDILFHKQIIALEGIMDKFGGDSKLFRENHRK